MGLKDIPPSDSNAILCRYKPYFATKSNIGYSGFTSEHESSNFCQSPAPRQSTIHKFSLPRFLAIHLARQSPFYGPPGHIDSRDGVNLCPSSVANPSRQHSRAHSLARWHRFVSIEHREPLQTALQGTLTRAMVCRKKNSFAKPTEPNTRSTAEKSGATSD